MLDVLLTSGMERWEAALEGKWRELILMSRPCVLEAEGCWKLFKGLGGESSQKAGSHWLSDIIYMYIHII